MRLISPAPPGGALLALEAATPTAAQTDTPGVITSAPRLYGIAFVTGLLADAARPCPLLPLAGALTMGLSLLALGASIAIWARRTMEQTGTAVNPRLPAAALVVSGPFRFTRNPLYLARTILYVGLALAMNTAWPLGTLIPLLAALHYGIIKREERYLHGRFGEAYSAYCARVPRWL